MGIGVDDVTVEADHQAGTARAAVGVHKMMCQRGHNHIAANCAVARKLVTRVWATLTSGTPYELRDVDDNPIDKAEARRQALTYTVPEHIRRRSRARNKPRRGRLSG